MNFKSILIVSAIVMSSLAAQAQITLGQPAYGGTGCPGGSAAVALTDDGSILSILFDQFTAESGNTTGRRIDRKACNLRIPVNVAQGFQVALLAFDYRGFVAVPYGATAIFDATYYFVGGKDNRYSKTFRGGIADSYSLRNELIAPSLVWSPCGKQAMLAVNSSVRTISNNSMQQTMLSVDSLDITSGLLYQVQWRRCSL